MVTGAVRQKAASAEVHLPKDARRVGLKAMAVGVAATNMAFGSVATPSLLAIRRCSSSSF